MSDQRLAAPPGSVLAAFAVESIEPSHIDGGEGKAWRAGSIVLKPEAEAEVVAWLATTVEEVDDGPDFRMARHVPATDGRWVVDGWAATTWLEGEHAAGRWDEVLGASRAFHAAIAVVPPPTAGVPRRATQWSVGDKVAWKEQEPAADVPGSVLEVITCLTPQLDTPWTGPPPQIIHGDIGGNVLFADDADLPPAIIDISPYVRPAAFADAIAVVDAIVWEAAPITQAFRFGTLDEHGEQLLARVVVYRLIAACEGWRAFPERVAAEVDAYRSVLTAIRT